MHIILVEDNILLATSIKDVLVHGGYTATLFSNGREAAVWLGDNPTLYDLVILDVLLPEMNGFLVCSTLRAQKITVPILMLTSKGTVGDAVEGLDSGADDYLKKPFVFDELLARVRSLLRRRPDLIEASLEITPHVTVDFLAHTAYKQGAPIHLTAKEYGILEYFLHHPNKIITQQELYDHVFDFADTQLSNTIEVHIKNLRKKLRTHVHELPLLTIRNMGYRFDYDK
jgi:DNA-binding response OmpR family regulator